MKFLITATRRQQTPMPPDAVPTALYAQRDWLAERVADRTIDVVYAFPGGGGVAIANAKGGDEIHGLLMSSPGFLLNDWDVRPLADIDKALSTAAEAFEQMAVGSYA